MAAARAFVAVLPERGSLLALDISRRRIGLAGTDVERRLVTPLLTLERRTMAADIDRLATICRERAVRALVIGLPINMDGSQGSMAGTVQGWARHFATALNLPVYLQDERLSTEAVKQAIAEGRLARPRTGALLDHLAAAIILQDSLRRFSITGQPRPSGPADSRRTR